MTIYYRVDLQDGVTPDEKPTGFYSQSDELNVTVFKGLLAAKRKFHQISSEEIDRLRSLRKRIRPVKLRKELVATTQTEGAGNEPDAV